MKTQHYKIKATADHIQNAYPGALVFANNESTDIIGFIDFVSDCEMSFMLFGPIEKEDYMINIAEVCDYEPRLSEIFKEDKFVAQEWAKLI